MVADAVALPTSSDCFVGGDGAGGGVILATTDGGTTWAAQTAPSRHLGNYRDLVRDDVRMRTVVGYDFAGASETAVVLATTDGGSTWSLQTLPSGIGALESVSCATSAICEAVGYQSTGPDAIVGTTDGGTTWTSQTAPYGFGGLLSVSCPSSTACEAVGGGYGAGGQAVATSDGGTTWTAQVVPSAVSALDSGFLCQRVDLCRWRNGYGNGGWIVAGLCDAVGADRGNGHSELGTGHRWHVGDDRRDRIHDGDRSVLRRRTGFELPRGERYGTDRGLAGRLGHRRRDGDQRRRHLGDLVCRPVHLYGVRPLRPDQPLGHPHRHRGHDLVGRAERRGEPDHLLHDLRRGHDHLDLAHPGHRHRLPAGDERGASPVSPPGTPTPSASPPPTRSGPVRPLPP